MEPNTVVPKLIDFNADLAKGDTMLKTSPTRPLTWGDALFNTSFAVP